MIDKRIPKSFVINGSKISVIFDKNLREEENCHGLACYRQNKIKIFPPTEIICEEKVVENFYHEFAHWILYFSGCAINSQLNDFIHNNEYFVDALGFVLKQAVESMEFKNGG